MNILFEKPGSGWPQQPEPVKNDHPFVWDLVLKDLEKSNIQHPQQLEMHRLMIEDIKRRDAAGEKKYGVRLQPFNGRNSLQDAYEEALDAIVYVRSALYENAKKFGKIVTQESEFYRIGLTQCYVTFLQAALALKTMIVTKEKESRNERSTVDTGDNGNIEEPRHDQSNIIVP